MVDGLDDIIEALEHRTHLAAVRCAAAFEQLLSGRAAPGQVERFLRAFAAKSETVEELVAAATVLRRFATRIACDDPDAIDTCGTGGDGVSTFNTSTAAAIVAAAAGATVAKHGNRSNTRASGSTEVLAELGVDTEASPSAVERCLRDARIGYLNAAQLHPAARHVGPARRAVGVRTIFNLLGPLTNPAGVRRQIIGVPRPDLAETMARAAAQLGAAHVLVVHGSDGLCDLSITGRSHVAEWRNGRLTRFEIVPAEMGLPVGRLDALLVTSPRHSGERILALLDGERGAARDHLLLNAGAALYVAGIAASPVEGVRRAAEAIDSGSARATLEEWRGLSREAT